jgi:hypothetical protein
MGFVAGLKVFAGLFGVYFLLTRQWRSLATFTGALGASVVVGGVALGWGTYADYLDVLTRVDWHASSWNASVFGGATRWFGSARNAGRVIDLGPDGYAVALALAAALMATYAIVIVRSGGASDPVGQRLGVGLTCVTMILVSPLGWTHYFPALLPVAAALLATTRPGKERRFGLLVVVVFLGLSSVPQSLLRPEQLRTESYGWWKSELPLLALMVLAAVQSWLLLRRRMARYPNRRSPHEAQPNGFGAGAPPRGGGVSRATRREQVHDA